MILTIHHGATEIGGSCVEIASYKARIIIDIGMPLVDGSERFDLKKYKHLSGPEMVKAGKLPDVKGLYSWDKESASVDAILISHSHLDHYGYLPFVRKDIPVYMSKGCREVMGIAHYFGQSGYDPKDARALRPWDNRFKIKDLAIKPYLVDHSAVDAFAYLVESGGRKIFYSGDFRGHGKKSVLFENMIKYPPKNIDALIMEGTGIDSHEGTAQTEQDLEDDLVNIFNAEKRLTVFSCSHQNIDRLTVLYNACLKTGKTLVILPYTAYILSKLKKLSSKIPQHDMPGIKIFFEKSTSTRKVLADRRLLKRLRKSKITYDEIDSGRASTVVLDSHFVRSRFAEKGLLDGALLLYSLWDGYLEDDGNFWKGYPIDMRKVHTSGHASPEELARFAEAIKPARIIPIHTQAPHKFREMFGERVRLAGDGEPLRI